MTQAGDPGNEPQQLEDERPPFMGTWGRLYAAVVVYMCALIVALYVMTLTLNR